ncbi:hypothetical protein [Weissella viridescens]|uniref:hypothetical protein n=1 Tax=Weissella viridescens TaxID=1629 RepID=UPI003AF2B802
MTKQARISKEITLSSMVIMLDSGTALPIVSLADTVSESASTSSSVDASENSTTVGTKTVTLTKTSKSLGLLSVTDNVSGSSNDLQVSPRSSQDILNSLTPEQKSTKFNALVQEQNLTPAEQESFSKAYDPSQASLYGIMYYSMQLGHSDKFASAGYIGYHALKLSGALKSGEKRGRAEIYSFLRELGVPKDRANRAASTAVKILF